LRTIDIWYTNNFDGSRTIDPWFTKYSMGCVLLILDIIITSMVHVLFIFWYTKYSMGCVLLIFDILTTRMVHVLLILLYSKYSIYVYYWYFCILSISMGRVLLILLRTKYFNVLRTIDSWYIKYFDGSSTILTLVCWWFYRLRTADTLVN